MGENDRGFWETLEAVVKFLCKLTGLIGAIALLGAALVTTEGVVVRKVLYWSTTWQIELSVFLLMYACFVGAAFGQMGEHHLNIDLLIMYLPPRAREILLTVAGGLSCVICAVIARYAWPMWWDALIHNEHSESLWGPPMWIPYIFLPVGMTLVFLQSLVQVRLRILRLRAGEYEKEIVPSELKDISIPGVTEQREQRGDHE